MIGRVLASLGELKATAEAGSASIFVEFALYRRLAVAWFSWLGSERRTFWERGRFEDQ